MTKLKVKNLKQLIEESIGEDFEILEEKTRHLTAPGEHYGSIMLGLDVVIQKKSSQAEEVLNLVAKLIPCSDILRQSFNIQQTCKKEINAYLNAFPVLIEFQKEYNVPKCRLIDLFPKCYGARISLDPNSNYVDEDSALIFENLNTLGYKTEDRMVGFNFETSKVVVGDLAQFHAVTIALKTIKPDVFEDKCGPNLEKNSAIKLPENVIKIFYDSVVDTVASTKELEPYLDRINVGVTKSMTEIGKSKSFSLDHPWDTLTHSDYWTSNILILPDETGRVIKSKMVDMQITIFNSAIRDLVFFLFTSVINSDLAEHYDDLIKVYYDTFIENLKDFDIDLKPFSWEEFLKEIERTAPEEFHHVATMLKVICTERDQIKLNSMEEFQLSNWARKDLLGARHKEKLRDTILEYIKRNWI